MCWAWAWACRLKCRGWSAILQELCLSIKKKAFKCTRTDNQNKTEGYPTHATQQSTQQPWVIVAEHMLHSSQQLQLPRVDPRRLAMPKQVGLKQEVATGHRCPAQEEQLQLPAKDPGPAPGVCQTPKRRTRRRRRGFASCYRCQATPQRSSSDFMRQSMTD